MSDRQEENIGNLKKLRAMIKKDMNTVAQVNKVQKALENLTPAGEKAMASDIAKFQKFRKNVLAREEKADTPPPKRAMASKEGGPKTPTKLPKPKPKRPTQTAAKKKSGVTFDTSGTLPGQTIKSSSMGRAVMKKRGGTFKGIF
jgi:septal ring factor EnvC (AmiA/AmiB activator)